MKRIFFALPAILLSGTMFMSSCSKSEDTTTPSEPPVINFVAKAGYVSGDATLTVGEKFKVNITAFPNTTSNSKLARLIVTRVFQNSPSTVLDTTFSLTSLNAEFTSAALGVAGQEKWFYKIIDKNNQSAEISLTITTQLSSGPINAFSMKILGAQSAATGSSFASIDGSVYTLAEAKANQAKVDWMYYYGATDLATLAAPDDADRKSVV